MMRYVYCFLLFLSFRIVRIRRRRKVHVRYLICVEFLVFILLVAASCDGQLPTLAAIGCISLHIFYSAAWNADAV